MSLCSSDKCNVNNVFMKILNIVPELSVDLCHGGHNGHNLFVHSSHFSIHL